MQTGKIPMLQRMKTLALILALFASSPALAHPHIFIDAGLELIFDNYDQLAQVRVTWEYGEFYSLLITQDYKLDNDFDGRLTSAEETVLAGFDANWIEGYNGDLVITLAGQPLTLSGPLEPTAAMAGGRITSTHLRDVTGTPNVGSEMLSAKMFDPSHYSAYDITRPVTITGRTTCALEKVEPDLDVELQKLQDRLASLGPDANPEEMGFPDVGDAFAPKSW